MHIHIYTYIDRRVQLNSAQLHHDLIVAKGLWDSGSLEYSMYTYTYIYIYIDRRVRIKSAQ